MRRSPLAVAVLVAVLVALAGGVTAYATMQKTVYVSVDGRQRAVHTFAHDVAGVLDAAAVRLGAHDVVAPDRAAPVHDGSRVVVRRGRLLALRLDGHERRVWVTSSRVADALAQLGIRDDGAFVSVSRGLTIPRRGLSLTVRTPQRVDVVVDGHLLQPGTTAATVADLLDQVHVTLAKSDTTSVPLTAYPRDGMTVQVTRVRARRELVSQDIPFQTVTRRDASMFTDERKVVQPGVPGVRVLDYVVTYRDGKPSQRTLTNAVVKRPPQDRVVAVGTKPRPQNAPRADGLNWAALANCESGGNPRAVSPGGTYRGLYQFDLGTWHAVGGAGDPIDASPGEQTYRAQLLYARSGASPWPVCGHYLYS